MTQHPAGSRRPGRVPVRARNLLAGAFAGALVASAAGCAPLAPPRPPQPVPPEPGGLQRLAAVVDSIMATPPLQRTHWGIVLRDPDHDVPLLAVNAERNFVPASNMKLVTGAVALAELGEGYRYRTAVAATGVVAGDTVAGALVVHGSGDPTLSARFHDVPFAALDSLADSVAVRGIRRFRDGLVVDATRFADGPVHFAWFLGDLPSRYAAGTAPFGLEEGTLLLVPRPGSAEGAPARVDVLPYDGVADLAVRLVTGPSDGRPRVSVARRIPGDTLLIEGSIPLGAAPDTLVLAAPDPDVLAARALAGALEARGIHLDGPVRVVRDTAELRAWLDPAGAAGPNAPGPGAPTRPVAPLFTWTSPPVADIVPAFMRPSQNWIAEQLVKTMGAEREGEGSWAAGLEVQRRYLRDQVGLDSTAFFLRDGSGLSNQSLLTPAGIVALLAHARAQPWFPTFRASLPRPDEEGGTLAGRLQGLEHRVAAKTGTLTHVNGLSGYIITDAGRELAFSILTNATGAPGSAVRGAMDAIVRAMADVDRAAR
jgi:serine-type D-Ala-D-Ala carboxypeptidase/endopeptidase (penicillin-binding protein 4)